MSDEASTPEPSSARSWKREGLAGLLLALAGMGAFDGPAAPWVAAAFAALALACSAEHWRLGRGG